MIKIICIECGEFAVEHEDDSYCPNCWKILKEGCL